MYVYLNEFKALAISVHYHVTDFSASKNSSVLDLTDWSRVTVIHTVMKKDFNKLK